MSRRTVFHVIATLLAVVAVARGDGWDYGSDSLDADLREWAKNGDVRIDSFGASAKGAPLWMVSISDRGDSLLGAPGRDGPKRRVMVHARTHPWEVQSLRVAREMILFLLDSGEVSKALRRDFIFNVVPQYNPDGVASKLERTNVNGVDLESNWGASSPQPEVQALKRLFQSFMAGAIPVEVALNLHSDQYNGKRFFVYHLEAGTSWIYTEMEKSFIAGAQAHFPGGIQNWDFLTSWASGTATRYPEGFWWTNYRERVLALTYEDDNSSTAGQFDSAGRALVLGTADHLRAMNVEVRNRRNTAVRLAVVAQGVRVRSASDLEWGVFDMGGRRLGGGRTSAGETIVRLNGIPRAPGSAVFVARFPDAVERLLLPAGIR